MDGESWFTAAKVAKALKMKPSTHVRAMLAELVQEGFLTTRLVVHRQDKRGVALSYKLQYRVSDEYQEKRRLL